MPEFPAAWLDSEHKHTLQLKSISFASILEAKIDKEKFNYEVSQAAIEGWFPHQLWGKMNQT